MVMQTVMQQLHEDVQAMKQMERKIGRLDVVEAVYKTLGRAYQEDWTMQQLNDQVRATVDTFRNE